MRSLVVCIALLFSLLPQISWADESTPLLYSKTTLAIMRKNPPSPPMLPWEKEPSAPENPAVTFDVEVRDAATIYKQKGWFNLSSPSPDSGVLMAFTAPGISPIVRSAQYTPLDILMIDREGKITQIIPNLNLSELDQEIMPQNLVLAFLFLKGGICEQKSIKPGDIVDYKIFRKPPVVWSSGPVAPKDKAAPMSDAPLEALPAIVRPPLPLAIPNGRVQ